MKKLLCVLSALLLCLALASCTKPEEETIDKGDQSFLNGLPSSSQDSPLVDMDFNS